MSSKEMLNSSIAFSKCSIELTGRVIERCGSGALSVLTASAFAEATSEASSEVSITSKQLRTVLSSCTMEFALTVACSRAFKIKCTSCEAMVGMVLDIVVVGFLVVGVVADENSKAQPLGFVKRL